MSTAVPGRPSGVTVYTLRAAVGALIIGVLLAVRPAFGAAALGALCFIPIAMTSVAAALAVWVVALFVKSVPGLVDTGMLLVIVAAWIGSALATGTRLNAVLNGQRALVGSLALLLAWLSLTVLWANDPQMGWQELRPWFAGAVVVVLVATSVQEPSQLRLILAAFVFGALLSFAIGLVGGGPQIPPATGHPAPPSNRFTGAEGNPNDLAAELLPVIVLAVALAADRVRPAVRATLILAAAGVTVGFAATESRGGLVIAVLVVAAGVIVYRGRRKVWLAIALVVVIAAATTGLYPHALSRVTSFSDKGGGRPTLWLVAWRINEDYPSQGVGLNNFRVVAPNYVRRPGLLRYVEQIDYPHIVHNTYLQLLAETGLVGTVLFLTVAGACLSAAQRAGRAFARAGRGDLASLSRAVFLAGVAVLAIQIFDTTVDDLRFWIVLALGPALLTIAARLPLRSLGRAQDPAGAERAAAGEA